MQGDEGPDHLFDGFNIDAISGGKSGDSIDGGSGNNKIVVGADDDTLVGFEGGDYIPLTTRIPRIRMVTETAYTVVLVKMKPG